MAERVIRARGVVRGTAEGLALVSPVPISFLGDVDMETGEIVAAGHPLRGESIAGKILVYPEAKGSSGGCVVLMSLAKVGRAPAAIVLMKPADFNIVEGAIVCGIPLLCEPDSDLLRTLPSGTPIRVDGTTGDVVNL
jgi:predicted aconitase with swiveling domain